MSEYNLFVINSEGRVKRAGLIFFIAISGAPWPVLVN